MLIQRLPLYPERDDVTLTAYVIDDSGELLNGASRPAVLICPGGAYLGCSDAEAEPVALRFAAMGYHTFVLRYSVLFRGNLAGPMPENPDTVQPHGMHPVPMREIGQSMLMIRRHADAWHVDADRIALCGFSAGAHNCAMYAVNWHTADMAAHFGVSPAQLRPVAVILGYMLSDYLQMKASPMEGFARKINALANRALLGVEDPDDATRIAVSPALHVSDQTPPMFLWSTSEDSLVPVEHTARMALALAQARVPFEVHVFETGDHGMVLADQSSAGSRDKIDPHVARWVPMAENWLGKRMALPLPERRPGL